MLILFNTIKYLKVMKIPIIAISMPIEVLEMARKVSKKERRNVSNIFVYSFCRTYDCQYKKGRVIK
jgi:hypothetical protein